MPQRAYDLAIAAGPAPTTTTSPGPGGACKVTHRVVNSWTGGYGGEIVIENRAASINSWTLTFSAPGVTVER